MNVTAYDVLVKQDNGDYQFTWVGIAYGGTPGDALSSYVEAHAKRFNKTQKVFLLERRSGAGDSGFLFTVGTRSTHTIEVVR